MVAARHPDLILLDVAMQEGRDGLGLLDRMRKESGLADIPIVLLTANTGAKESALNSEFVVHLQDSLYPAEIINRIQAVLPNLKTRYYTPPKKIQEFLTG